MRSHPGQGNVESFTASKSWRPRKKSTSNKLKQPSRISGDGPENYMPGRQITSGERSGHHQNQNRQTFPAKDARCHKCSKQAHFTKCCRAKSRVNMVNEVELAETSSSDSDVFLGKVSYMSQLYELRCRGEFQAMLKYGPKSWKATIYALDDLDFSQCWQG